MIRVSRQFVFLVFAGLTLQYVVIYLVWTFLGQNTPDTARLISANDQRLRKKITIIVRDFNNVVNDLPATSSSLSAADDVERILIISDRKLYPPVAFTSSKVELFQSHPDLRLGKDWKDFRKRIKTEWVMLVPDGVILDPHAFQFDGMVMLKIMSNPR